MHRIGTILLALLLLLIVAQPLHAEDAASARSFDIGLERIHEALKKERFKRGLEKLRSLLKKHKETPHARAHRIELIDLAKRLSFGKQYGAPDAQDVVSGKLLRWDKQKGYISIQYTPDTCADLKRSKGGMLIFPARIKGSFLLQVYGREYPYTTANAPQIAFGGDPHPKTGKQQTWHLIFGVPRYIDGEYERWLPASILHTDGNVENQVTRVENSPAKRGKPYKLQLKVTDVGIGAGINGKTWGKIRKPKGVWGTIAFTALGWRQMALTGTIEPAWIQNRLDLVVQKQLREFKRSYKPAQVLPAWLFETGKAPDAPAAPVVTKQPDLPEPLPDKHKRTLSHYKMHGDAGRWTRALKMVAKLRKEGAPDLTCDFLAARANFELGRVKEGLTEVERILQAQPDFLLALLLRGRLYRRGGAHDQALAAFEEATQRHEGDPLAYRTAVMSMLYAGRPDAAEKLIEEATRKGALNEELETLSEVLVKARSGPTWNQVFEYRSRNYEVLSDIDKKTCKLAADLLEEALTSYRVNLHWTSGEKTRRYRVYLFNGQAGFVEYCRNLEGFGGTPHKRVAGLYTFLLKQLLIWHLPERDEMLETIRHEGFHQYLDRFMPDPPIWFNEGLAVYHQAARKTTGGLKFGAVNKSYLKQLDEGGLPRIDDFLEQTIRQFQTRGSIAYAEAWSFVHMLRHGKPAYRSIFKAMVKALETEPGLEVIDRLFPQALRRELKADWKAYVAGLR